MKKLTNDVRAASEPQVRSSELLGGVHRETVMLAAGYCSGLSQTDRYNFDERERVILKAAGDALLAAASKLYAS